MTARRRRWSSKYKTDKGRRPLYDCMRFYADDRAAILAALDEVAEANSLEPYRAKGDIYEVVAPGAEVSYRILFAKGRDQDELLGLVLIEAKAEKNPGETIELARERLGKWKQDSDG